MNTIALTSSSNFYAECKKGSDVYSGDLPLKKAGSALLDCDELGDGAASISAIKTVTSVTKANQQRRKQNKV